MYITRHVVALVTDALGACIAYSPVVTGKVSQVRYVKTDFTDGVDFVVTSEATGETIWAQDNINASVTVAPRQATDSVAGVASEYATGFAVTDKIAVANDRIKVVIANGGATKSGVIHFVIE